MKEVEVHVKGEETFLNLVRVNARVLLETYPDYMDRHLVACRMIREFSEEINRIYDEEEENGRIC